MYNLNSEKKIFDIKERTFRFGVEIVRLVLTLPKNSAGFAISGQLVRSGTSIGANVIEAQNCELIKILTSIIKKSKLNS